MEEFEARFAAKLASRASTWRAAISILLESGRPLTIVETGCLREIDNWAGDGQSTLLLAWLASQTGGHLYSVDCSTKSTSLARSVVGEETTVVCDDSIVFLSRFGGNIDLLYLDSLDFDGNDPLRSGMHHLLEFTAAQRFLSPGSVVCVDDTYPQSTGLFGKGMLIGRYMDRIGCPIIAQEHQTVWQLR